MKGLFITGTDTGVGKTIVAAAIARALAARGRKVGVMKPAESGCPRVDGRLVAQDAAFLRAASGCQAASELVNPYAFVDPVAPALAAEADGVRIEIDVIDAAYRRLAAAHEMVLVEGAGGLLTPLTGELTMAGLAAALDLPIVVVARNCLGAINHTSLTVRAARAEGLTVVGVVLNHPDQNTDPAVRSNADALRRWAGAPLLGCLPHVAGLDLDALAGSAEPFLDVLVSNLSDPARDGADILIPTLSQRASGRRT